MEDMLLVSRLLCQSLSYVSQEENQTLKLFIEFFHLTCLDVVCSFYCCCWFHCSGRKCPTPLPIHVKDLSLSTPPTYFHIINPLQFPMCSLCFMKTLFRMIRIQYNPRWLFNGINMYMQYDRSTSCSMNQESSRYSSQHSQEDTMVDVIHVVCQYGMGPGRTTKCSSMTLQLF